MPEMELPMVLCPVALVAGCRKCPIVGACPLKSAIGDYRPDDPAKRSTQAGKSGTRSKKPR